MPRTKKKIMIVIAATAAILGPSVLLSPSAHASLACDATTIQINEGRGGEPPTFRQGHTHFTGDHYVRSISSNRLWNWWADNDGGADGDTADTPYGIKQC